MFTRCVRLLSEFRFSVHKGAVQARVFLPNVPGEPLAGPIGSAGCQREPDHPQLACVYALVYSGRLEIARRYR